MPDLDVRITSMYPPGVQGGIRAYASATIAGCFAVRGIKIVEGGKDGLFMSMPSRKTQENRYPCIHPVFSCDGGIPQRAETSGIGSVWRGTVHGTGIYLTDSTPSKSRAEHGLI